MINIHTKLIQDDLPEMGVDAFAILICITTHINAKKRAWPGIDRLRKMTGLSRERTYAAIAKLITLNHIERKQDNVKGEWGKVVYRLTTQYLGVYVGVSEFPMESAEESEPLYGKPEYGYPEHGKPKYGKAASISIVQDGSISKEEVLTSISNEIEGAHEIGEPPIPITGYQVTVIEPVIEKPKPKKFSPPALEDIQTVFSRKLSALANISGPEYWAEWEARKFEEHYKDTNWKVGKAKMKDWRRAVSGWITRSMERRTYLKPCPTAPDYNNFNQTRNGKEQQVFGPNRAELAFARALARSNSEPSSSGYEAPAWK